MTTLAASASETYQLLVSLLTKCPQTIEILPGNDTIWMHTRIPGDIKSESSYAPFLFVEGNLGIPEKLLYKVYLHAVGVFRSARSRMPTRPTVALVPQDLDLDASLVCILAESSSILILTNPSHQTALNARKHLVQMQLINPHAELRFTASLLSSQHCTKHAELWYHRRWILGTVYGHVSGATGMDSCSRLQFTSRGALQQELELASRACELYPRNYFAWTHRLICVRSLLLDYLAGMDTVGFVPVFRSEITRIKGWIDRHVSDYSAIHTTLTLCQAAYQSGDLSLMEVATKEDLLGHAISLVRDYPTHETLWMYVRTALCIPDVQQAQQLQQFMDQIVHPLVHLQHQKVQVGTKEDLVNASQYARQFLDRRAGY